VVIIAVLASIVTHSTLRSDAKVANRETKKGLARRDRKGSLNDGQIRNPSNPFGIVPLSNFIPRGFGFVHHSIAILYHEVPNPSSTVPAAAAQLTPPLPSP
jgi:hypothetical protein